MTRAIIERVTCDKCGQVSDFEQFNNGSMMARLESLTQWIRGLGWYVDGSIRTVDICPRCNDKMHAKR